MALLLTVFLLLGTLILQFFGISLRSLRMAVVRFLGKNGIDATTKLMGFLLVCIGVEFVLSGWAMA